jgi:hypothetical protein
MRMLGEIIASDLSLLVTFNLAIEGRHPEQSKSQSQSQITGPLGRVDKVG